VKRVFTDRGIVFRLGLQDDLRIFRIERAGPEFFDYLAAQKKEY